LHKANKLVYCRLYDTHPAPYSAHLFRSSDSQSRGNAWLGLVLGICGLPTSYQLIPSKRNPVMALASFCHLKLWTAPTSHRMACIFFKQDCMVLKSKIKHCGKPLS